MSTSLRFIVCGVLFLTVVFAVRAQDSKSQSPLGLDYSRDPCGNPMMESQLWTIVEGKVTQVTDGQTLMVNLTDSRDGVRVRIVGIALESGTPSAAKAKEVLSQFLLDKSVEILVNPEWSQKKNKPSGVAGVVHLKQGPPDDAGYLLVSKGLARYQEPPPHSMPAYNACQYRRAESSARDAKLGIWAQN